MQIKATSQWVRALPLTAKRGEIVDTAGNTLAQSFTTYDVYVRAKEVENSARTALVLSELLGLNYDVVYQKAKDVYISESLLKLNVDEALADKIANQNLSGVYLTENISRTYPYGKLLAQTLGFLSIDSVGQTGLENYYDKILSGTNGKYLTQSDVRGITLSDSLNYYVEAIDGLNIKLNVDINIQNIVETVFEDIVEEHHPKSVSAIVLNPKNSQVLAMAISPTFDLNNIPRQDVATLLSLSKNTMVTDVYEPGSTFKIFTLAAALSEGLTNLNETFYCPGYRIVDGERIKCWKTTGHGHQTLVECVQNSCNCCFMDLALRLGKDKLYSYLERFGVGSATGVDIAGESSGIMIDKNLVKNVDLARIGFGQSVAVSQLQLINSFCMIINGGTRYTPSLLKNYYDSDGQVVYNHSSMITSHSDFTKVSQDVRYLLEQCLSKAGDMTFVEGYKIAGKTGTAQKYGSDKRISTGKYVSSFFGFINGENPEYALLLCVDEPSSGAYYGSVVAKPYAKQIFEQIIKYKNIAPHGTIQANETFNVPNFIGLSASEAIAQLDKMKVYYEVSGEGNVVTWQFPSQDTSVSKASTILINLG